MIKEFKMTTENVKMLMDRGFGSTFRIEIEVDNGNGEFDEYIKFVEIDSKEADDLFLGAVYVYNQVREYSNEMLTGKEVQEFASAGIVDILNGFDGEILPEGHYAQRIMGPYE